MAAIELESAVTTGAFHTLLFDRSHIAYGRRAIITLILFLLQQFGGCTFVAVSPRPRLPQLTML